MPRPIKVVLAGIIFILSASLIAGFFSWRYAVGLLWSFAHGETAIGFWLAIGISLKWALFFAIACSTIDIFGWFYIADHAAPLFKRFWHFAPKNKTPTGENWRRKLLLKMPYVILPLFAVEAYGGVWLGIAAVKSLRLHKPASMALIILGNAAKMFLWGFGFDFIRWLYAKIGMQL